MDETIGPLVGITGAIAIGAIALGGAAVMAGGKMLGTNALHVAYSLGKGTLDTITGIHDALQEMKEIAIEEKMQFEREHLRYLEAVEKNKEKKHEYLQKSIHYLMDQKLAVTDGEIQSCLEHSGQDSIKTLHTLMQGVYYLDKLSELSFMLTEENIDVTTQDLEVYQLKAQLEDAIKKHPNKINILIESLKAQLEQYKDIYQISKNQIIAINKIDQVFFNIEHRIDDPILLVWSNEIYDSLKNTLETDQNEQKIHELIELKKVILSVYMDIANITGRHDFMDLKRLVDSVHTILSDETLSLDTKMQMIKVRKGVMLHEYKSMLEKYEKLIDMKRDYDTSYQILTSYQAFLKKALTTYHFVEDTAKQALDNLKHEILLLEPQVKEKEQNLMMRKKIHDVMLEMNYSHIVSNDVTMGNMEVYQDIYHIEAGNVVTVSLFPHGELNYKVSGTEIPGIANNKQEVVKTMKTFCKDVKVIREKLKAKGILTENKELLEPHESYVTEIKLDGIPISKREIIRKAKLKTIASETLKSREII